MSEAEEGINYRAEIAARNRRYAFEERERKLSMAVVGLMVYSAFSNFLSSVLLFGSSPIDAGIGLILGILYSLGVYRVWSKDDARWWPVAVPAGISIALLSLIWIGGMHRPVPLLINAALLILVPIRRRALEAVPNKSFKPNPLRGSA